MIVTPAPAGVQLKDFWIPAGAGMTVDNIHRYLNIIREYEREKPCKSI
jgi:hypothetical protein